MLRTGYDRGTKDGDVLETADLLTATKARLQQLAGINSALHIRYRVYIDIVSNGVPFLPHGPRFHPIATLNTQLRRFDISALDVVDIVVSKLKRIAEYRDDAREKSIEHEELPLAREVGAGLGGRSEALFERLLEGLR